MPPGFSHILRVFREDSLSGDGVVAKVVLIGIEDISAGQIGRALSGGLHEVERKPKGAPLTDFIDSDIVFAGGGPNDYMPLLRRIREVRPRLAFVVVTRVPETREWLDALEAGATDYCSGPFETRQVHWLMESALPARTFAA